MHQPTSVDESSSICRAISKRASSSSVRKLVPQAFRRRFGVQLCTEKIAATWSAPARQVVGPPGVQRVDLPPNWRNITHTAVEPMKPLAAKRQAMAPACG
jgi:hypothetical protein